MEKESFIAAYMDIPEDLSGYDGRLYVFRVEDFCAWCRRVRDAHEREVDGAVAGMTDAQLAEHGLVRLPVDADGEPIHVGDVVTMQLLFGGESKPLVVDRMELSHGRDGDLWCVALDTDEGCWNQPSLMRHYTPPTVDGILRDFGVDIAHALDADPDATVPEAVIAEYAAKLRLAGDAE